MDDNAAEPLRVTQWLIRSYPYCPTCKVRMQRDNPDPREPLMATFECKGCGYRHKSRDRIDTERG